jgi:serine/threonine protein kinase
MMTDQLLGFVFGERYKITALIGEGTTSKVYLADDQNMKRRVAIKIFKDIDPEQIENLVSQLRYFSQLNHPNIVPIYAVDIQEVDGIPLPYVLMPYATKGNLANRLRSQPLEKMEALAMFYDVCLGLEYAHYQKILHLHLKPENILFDDYGLIRVADVGFVQLLGQATLPQVDTLSDETELEPVWVQNPANLVKPESPYQGPEQVLGGEIGVYTDVYALGILLHEMLTGKPPELDWLSFRRKPKLDDQLPVGIRNVIHYASAFEIQYRYHSIAKLMDALKMSVFGRQSSWQVPQLSHRSSSNQSSPQDSSLFNWMFFGLLGWSIFMWAADSTFTRTSKGSPILTVYTVLCLMPVIIPVVALLTQPKLASFHLKFLIIFGLQTLVAVFFLEQRSETSNEGVTGWLALFFATIILMIILYLWGFLPYWIILLGKALYKRLS